jgi:hypothetical protein
MGALSGITPESLIKAVRDGLLLKAISDEEARQGRALTKNERVAFKCGWYAGCNCDAFRDGDWEAAAESLRSKKRPGAQAG